MDATQYPKGTPQHAAQIAALTIEPGEHAAGSSEPHTINVHPADQQPGDIFVRHEMWGHVRVMRRPDGAR